MEIIKKILDLILEFLKFSERQAFKKEEEKRESEEKTKLDIEVKEKTKQIAEKKKNAKVDRTSDNVFGD